ncbi:alpha/beta hydrolase-fold protein [Melioribacteraceae bacterium 4301-Me]|uniref:carboxylesterase family protein n=1 Tax=Pyranulibacter aquaticus TaxID=3163344 RepID=UPI003596636F
MKNFFISALISLLGLLLIRCSTMDKAINIKGTQTAAHFRATITKNVEANYLIYLPEGYNDSNKKWPLLLFLHGAGERGTDINLVKKHGPPKLIDEGKQFPFIVVSPQCPLNQRWSTDVLISLLDEIEKNYNVDLSRVYLTGLSMGGYGAWQLAIAYPDRFAAVIPICGWGDTFEVCKLKNVPLWVFHGAKDNVVPIEAEQRMVDALKQCGGNVQFTIYPEAGHDAWTETYNNPNLYVWMLQQINTRRK